MRSHSSRPAWRRSLVAPIVLVSMFLGSTSFAAGDGRVPADGDPTTPQMNSKVFDAVWRTIHEKYYDLSFNGADWTAVQQRFRPRAAEAATVRALYEVLSDMTKLLEDAHVGVQTPERVALAKHRIAPDFGLRMRAVEGRVAVTEVVPGSVAAAEGVERGWLLTHLDGKPVDVTGGFSYRPGEVARFTFVDLAGSPKDIEITCCPNLPLVGVQRAEVLPGNVLFIRFDGFGPATGEWVARQIREHKEARGLVVDLRSNRGGLLEAMRESLSPLFSEDVIAGVYIKRGDRRSEIRCSGSGRRAYRGPVVVLTDRETSSAAEIFAATVQEARRGRIVGRVTAGDVLPSFTVDLPDGGRLHYSFADFRTATGVRLEGRGVVPDELLELRLEDIRGGVDGDLERALAVIRNELGP